MTTRQFREQPDSAGFALQIVWHEHAGAIHSYNCASHILYYTQTKQSGKDRPRSDAAVSV